jgi:hypothetical protein
MAEREAKTELCSLGRIRSRGESTLVAAVLLLCRSSGWRSARGAGPGMDSMDSSVESTAAGAGAGGR